LICKGLNVPEVEELVVGWRGAKVGTSQTGSSLSSDFLRYNWESFAFAKPRRNPGERGAGKLATTKILLGDI